MILSIIIMGIINIKAPASSPVRSLSSEPVQSNLQIYTKGDP